MHGMGWLGEGWFMMVFWWGLLIVGFVLGVKWLFGTKIQAKETALEILKKRYAKSEISKKEFDAKKKEFV